MVKHLLLLPAVLLLAMPLAAQQQKPAHKPAADAAPAPTEIHVEAARPEVKQIFKFDCAICHGESGNGKSDLAASMNLTLLDWTNPSSLAGKSDEELFKAIRNGKDKMPGEDAARAKDDEVRGLVKYIRNLSKGQATPAAEPAPAAAPTAATTPTSPTAN